MSGGQWQSLGVSSLLPGQHVGLGHDWSVLPCSPFCAFTVPSSLSALVPASGSRFGLSEFSSIVSLLIWIWMLAWTLNCERCLFPLLFIVNLSAGSQHAVPVLPRTVSRQLRQTLISEDDPYWMRRSYTLALWYRCLAWNAWHDSVHVLESVCALENFQRSPLSFSSFQGGKYVVLFLWSWVLANVQL